MWKMLKREFQKLYCSEGTEHQGRKKKGLENIHEISSKSLPILNIFWWAVHLLLWLRYILPWLAWFRSPSSISKSLMGKIFTIFGENAEAKNNICYGLICRFGWQCNFFLVGGEVPLKLQKQASVVNLFHLCMLVYKHSPFFSFGDSAFTHYTKP